MYLFDTSAIIDWLYNKRLGSIISGPISISSISLAELLPTAREKDKETLDAVNLFFSRVKIISIDEMIARKAGSYKYKLRRLGSEKPIIDLLIAASAKLNDLKLVTLDKDFEVIANQGDIDLLLVKDKQ